MATRRFNPKTGRYEDVVSSKGFRLPQLSLPKFSLFQTDRQIKDLAQSSRKAKQRSTDPAHKRVEKLKAENITHNEKHRRSRKYREKCRGNRNSAGAS